MSGPETPPEEAPRELEGPPPLLGTWGRLYAALIGLLAVYIALFYALTVAFE